MALGTIAQVPSPGPVTPAPARTMPGHREPPSPGRVSTQRYSPRNPGRGSVSQRPETGVALSGWWVWVEEKASGIRGKCPSSDHLLISQTLLKQSSLGQFPKTSKELRNSIYQKILLYQSGVLCHWAEWGLMRPTLRSADHGPGSSQALVPVSCHHCQGPRGQGDVEEEPGFESNPKRRLQKFHSSKTTCRSEGAAALGWSCVKEAWLNSWTFSLNGALNKVV